MAGIVGWILARGGRIAALANEQKKGLGIHSRRRFRCNFQLVTKTVTNHAERIIHFRTSFGNQWIYWRPEHESNVRPAP
jgi:hypothetical protein